ncbi:MAG TPA: class I SAM-dependent methyltransferase [Thermoanaerobaculia bacterium]
MNPAEYAAMFAVEDRHWWYVGVRREIERALETVRAPGNRRPRILDAGCGTGGLLANLMTPAWKVGLEISSEGIRLSQSRGLAALVSGSVSALPFADGSFDAVVSIDVLCHSRVEERQALEEAARVLRPGGILLAQVPAFDFLRGEHDAAVWTKRRYRRAEVSDLVSKAGLAPRRSGYRNALLFPAAAVLRLFRRRQVSRESARSDVRPVPRIVNVLLSGVLAIERRFRGSFPFGLSVFCVAEKPLVARDTIRRPADPAAAGGAKE